MARGGDRGERHPSAAELECFLLGEMSSRQATPVIAHLIRGCNHCRQRMAPLASLVLAADRRVPEPVPGDGAEYDFPLFKAFSTARRYAGALAREGSEADGRLRLFPREVPAPEPAASGARGDRERCESLFELCRALSNSDPEGMVLAASLAVQIAERVEADSGVDPETADLRARARAELGNARRVADCLSAAEADLAQALEIAGRGTGDPLLLARLMDLTASLYMDQRKLDEAILLLDCVQAIHRQHGDPHAAGRALISQGMALGYAFESERAVEYLGQGLRQIDAGREPKIVLAATHNLLHCLVDCGRSAEAQALIGNLRALYAAYGGRFDDLRVLWLEGNIAAGLGDDEEAERSFLRVREGFEAAGLLSDIALISLHLAALWLRQGRTTEVRHMVDELVAAFRSNGIRREALGALLMFKEALHKDRVTESLLRTVTTEIWRLDRSPSTLRHPAGP
ncbi:MAG: hypothetical protein QOF89_3010 [Acidobacteriota bacterium]|jgi:tetratricopeptide (TPR) repeat protein|nr:hypothetical protein [Acidobacteriota bacterium]